MQLLNLLKLMLLPFSLKEKLTGQTGNNGTENIEIIVTLKYLKNFWQTIETPLINCEEVTLDLNWPENCVIRYSGY